MRGGRNCRRSSRPPTRRSHPWRSARRRPPRRSTASLPMPRSGGPTSSAWLRACKAARPRRRRTALPRFQHRSQLRMAACSTSSRIALQAMRVVRATRPKRGRTCPTCCCWARFLLQAARSPLSRPPWAAGVGRRSRRLRYSSGEILGNSSSRSSRSSCRSSSSSRSSRCSSSRCTRSSSCSSNCNSSSSCRCSNSSSCCCSSNSSNKCLCSSNNSSSSSSGQALELLRVAWCLGPSQAALVLRRGLRRHRRRHRREAMRARPCRRPLLHKPTPLMPS
mmetsp:Transcript_20029/g.40671  ORF Transcript_20029/g.40671 Transcript_20029/m.40671 type:complete len:278 (-) Transcript_20029:120-953(-)